MDNNNENLHTEENDKSIMEIKTFSSVRSLAEHSKHMIECYVTKDPPYKGSPLLSWNDLVIHLGGIMDFSTNRRMVLKAAGLSKTLVTVLRDDRVSLFIKALKEYKPELYVNLV